jgi:hypothetical protein
MRGVVPGVGVGAALEPGLDGERARFRGANQTKDRRYEDSMGWFAIAAGFETAGRLRARLAKRNATARRDCAVWAWAHAALRGAHANCL